MELQLTRQRERHVERFGTGEALTIKGTWSLSFAGRVGDPIKVKVTANYKWMPFVGGATFPIKAESTMRLERPANPALNGQCS